MAVIQTEKLPHNTEAEKAVLGGMLRSTVILNDAISHLDVDDFFELNQNHRVIFKAMQSLFKAQKVIGTGTCLDSARLRYEIGNKLDINTKNIHAYVIGEHGDTEFVPWTSATVGLTNVKEFISLKDMEYYEDKVRNMAYEIIKMKGNTSYGIGMVTTRITNAILNNENALLTISSYDKENDIFIGYPTILNRDGAIKRIAFPLNNDEEKKYQKSINTLKEAIEKIKDL